MGVDCHRAVTWRYSVSSLTPGRNERLIPEDGFMLASGNRVEHSLEQSRGVLQRHGPDFER